MAHGLLAIGNFVVDHSAGDGPPSQARVVRIGHCRRPTQDRGRQRTPRRRGHPAHNPCIRILPSEHRERGRQLAAHLRTRTGPLSGRRESDTPRRRFDCSDDACDLSDHGQPSPARHARTLDDREDTGIQDCAVRPDGFPSFGGHRTSSHQASQVSDGRCSDCLPKRNSDDR